MQAIRAMDLEQKDHLHYSSIVSVARSEVPRIREIFIWAIEEIRVIVRESKEETAFRYAADLFEVLG